MQVTRTCKLGISETVLLLYIGNFLFVFSSRQKRYFTSFLCQKRQNRAQPENVTDEANAKLHVTIFSTISLYIIASSITYSKIRQNSACTEDCIKTTESYCQSENANSGKSHACMHAQYCSIYTRIYNKRQTWLCLSKLPGGSPRPHSEFLCSLYGGIHTMKNCGRTSPGKSPPPHCWKSNEMKWGNRFTTRISSRYYAKIRN